MFSFASLFMECSKGEELDVNTPDMPSDSPNNNPEESPNDYPVIFQDDYLDTTIHLDDVNATEFYKGCYLNSVLDVVPISDGAMKLESNINKKVQTYFLTDEGDNIYMMTRLSNTEQNKNVVFSVESTALAFVTFHPLFAHIDGLAYDVLQEAIFQNQHFPKVRTEVNNVIKQKRDLYSQDNTALFDAINLLLDELMVFANYQLKEEVVSRALTNDRRYFPFRLNSSGSRLDFQIFGLNPNFYGTATHANGSTENIVVTSHDDFGFLAGLESVWNILNKNGWDANQYGEISSYTFPADGECQFHFSCNTEDNLMDLLARIVSSAGDMIGVDVNESAKEFLEICTDLGIVVQEVNNAGYELGMYTFPYYVEAIGNAVGGILENDLTGFASQLLQTSIEQSFDNEMLTYVNLKQTTKDKNILKAYTDRINGLLKSQTLFKRAMGAYSLAKGIENILVRLIAAYNVSDYIDFKFCCYNDEIRDCSNLRKYKGDNQTGIYGAELKEPISVMANIDMGNISDYVVKFEVYNGGGTLGDSGNSVEYVEIREYTAKIKWTLGEDSQEQIVRAYLCEKESKEEICEPVEFKATALDYPELQIIGGNNQIGYENTLLEESLQVGLSDDILIDYENYQVKFEVESGGGSLSTEYAKFTAEGIAECNWTLGTQAQGEQKVKAVLVSAENKEVISESVYFEAEIESEEEKELRAALIKLYQTTDGDNWTNNINWCSSKPLTEWYGISKDEENHYTLSLNENNLTGFIDQKFPENVLVDLNCSRNQLMSIKVSNSTSLTLLLCGFNQLTTLEVSGCTALTRLECISNQLASLDLSDCMALTDLDCSWNQFTSLDNIANGTSVKRLTCGYNPYTSFKISNFPVIEELSCPDMDSNGLLTINVSNCTTLVKLSCHTNNVKEFNASGCIALKDLDCWQCTFEIFNVAGCTALKNIYFKNGIIKTLLDFSNCTSLTTIPLASLLLYSCTTLNVSGCTALTSLYAVYRGLSSLNVSGCTALTSLDCYGNQLTSLDVSGCIALTSLCCEGNQLVSLDVSSCLVLKELHCYDNQLERINVTGCINLTNLRCSYNQLTTLDISGCVALDELDCRKNRITKEIVDCFAQIKYFSYDERYSYYLVKGENGKDIIKYEDNGVGWWYAGEPEKGYHGPN